MSFHGIPKRYAQLGDDYPIRCEDTSRALRAALPLPAEKIIMTYQSRFGREPWLTPYTDETLKVYLLKALSIFSLFAQVSLPIVWKLWKK